MKDRNVDKTIGGGYGMDYIFKTKRCYCRDFLQEDFEAVHTYASDKNVVKYMEWGPNNEQDTLNFIDYCIKCSNQSPRLEYTLAIELIDTREVIGGVTINIDSLSNKEAVIGYTINPRYWKQGYASEVALGAIKYGLGTLGMHRIEATCDVRNVGSAKVLEKVGMVRDGEIREHIYLRGSWRSSYLYSILEEEFCKNNDTC